MSARSLQQISAHSRPILLATFRAPILTQPLDDSLLATDRARELPLRNAHARALGLSDHRTLALLVEETEEAALATFLDDLERASEGPWAAERARLEAETAARRGGPARRLRPWQVGNVFLQSPPPEPGRPDPLADADPILLTRRTFEGVGLDVGPALGRSDLHPRDGKNPHAFCMHVDRAGDVRVLANVVPSARWTRTMLHEFGHAAYDLGLDPDLPWILRCPAHPCATEGVAMFFDRLVHDPRWRERIAGLGADPEAATRARRRLLVFVRFALVVCRFEAALYADPDQDLDRTWWDLVERLQGIERPDPAPPGVWAAKIHLACHPVYYHGYLLGESVASRLDAHLRGERGSAVVDDPEVGPWLLSSVFRPGATWPWAELFRLATGAAPDAAGLLADL